MSRRSENTAFECVVCGNQVLPLTNGSYRNHCPFCLCSLHVDEFPGDRASVCRGIMRPIGLRLHSKKGYQILHRCERCGTRQWNKAATDTVQPDNWELLRRLPVV